MSILPKLILQGSLAREKIMAGAKIMAKGGKNENKKADFERI